MSPSSQHLTLFEERCDRCGACKSVCPRNALKIGSAFIYVDWRKCDGCLACAQACDRGAIAGRVVPLRSSSAKTTVPLAEVNKVVVGSRAEAKAVRKAAVRAAASAAATPAAKPAKRPPKAAPAAKPAAKTAAKPAAKTAVSSAGWTLLDAGAVLAIMLVTLAAKNAVLALDQVALMPQLGKMAVRAVVLSAFYIVQIASFGWLAGRHGRPAVEAFGLRRGAAKAAGERPSGIVSAGLVLALLVGCEFVSISYGLGMEAIGIGQPERLSSDLAGVFGSGALGFALAFALVAIAAPLAEEIAFRGILLPAFGGRLGMWWSIGISALLYAAYHANLWLFVPTAVLGVALGWLTWTRRSLWPAIALHVLYNAAAVAAAFAAVNIPIDG